MDSLSYDIYKSEFKVLSDRLQKAFLRNDENEAKIVFMRMGFQVPYESFTWIARRAVPSLSLLDLLFHRQLLCDNFINGFLNFSSAASELTVFDALNLLIDSDNLCRNDIYFIQELLSDGDPTSLNKFPVSNIKKNYKDISLCLDEIILDTAYYAQPKILEKVLHLTKVYGLVYKFKPLDIGKHKSVYQWIVGNLSKSSRGEPLGWRVGPDSGKWPSTDIMDYKYVCNLLHQLM